MLACDVGSAEDFDWGPTMRAMRSVIVHPACMIEGKRPEVDLEFFRPMEERMLHHGASTFGDSSNSALGDTVLMMCANAG